MRGVGILASVVLLCLIIGAIPVNATSFGVHSVTPLGAPPPPSGWNYSTGIANVEDVAVSGNGGYVAAVSSANDLYLFNTSSNTPEAIWQLPAGGFNVGSLAISAASPTLNGKVGTSSYVLVGVGGNVYAYAYPNATPLWNYSPVHEIQAKDIGYTVQSIRASVIAVTFGAQYVAAAFSYTATNATSGVSDYGVWLSYLNGISSGEVWNWSQESGTGTQMATTGLSITPDGTYMVFSFNDGISSYMNIYKYSGSPPPLVQQITTSPVTAVSQAIISPDGSTMFQVGGDGYWIYDASNRNILGYNDTQDTPGTVFGGSSLVAASYNGSRFVVDAGGNNLYGFNYSSATPPAGYDQPIWEIPTGNYPLISLQLNPNDASYGVYVTTSSSSSSLGYFYAPGDVGLQPVPYRTVQLPSTALSASSSTTLSVTAVGMSSRGGSAVSELEVVFDYGPQAPPAVSLSISQVTYDSFLVSWTPSTLVDISGFPQINLALTPADGPNASAVIVYGNQLPILGLHADTTYTIELIVTTWWGLYLETVSATVTTFPAPAPPDPFAWSYAIFAGLLSAGFLFTGIAAVLSLPEKRAPEEGGGRGGGLFAKRPRSSSKKGLTRRSPSTRLPPGFGGG